MVKNIGFALIDLLIVMAIMTILGAIALPNFWTAQTQSQVSRAKAEMKIISAAIGAYFVDYNTYPLVSQEINSSGQAYMLNSTITTPIAYIPALYQDPFGFSADYDLYKPYRITSSYWYSTKSYYTQQGFPWQVYPNKQSPVAQWVLMSKGPDKAWAQASYPSTLEVDRPYDWAYDPSNGTVSRGNIVRSGP